MKSFKEYLIENAKEMSWDRDPDIGWWEDNDPITFYHGTHKKNLKNILSSFINAPSLDPKNGIMERYVSLALEPNTAFGYASMTGGEMNFRKKGNKATNVPAKDRVVLVIKLPRSFVKKYMVPMRGNVKQYVDKLINKEKYLEWKKEGKSDSEYYAITEIRIPDKIDSKYIIGWMYKK